MEMVPGVDGSPVMVAAHSMAMVLGDDGCSLDGGCSPMEMVPLPCR